MSIEYTAIAQSSQKSKLEREFLSIKFTPPKNGKKPKTGGAGTRNPDSLKCSSEDSEIMAIMPDSNHGLTTQQHPNIFFYTAKTSAKQVVVSFESQDKKYHQTAFLPINNSDLIMSFALPRDKPGLENNLNYQWKLTLVCGSIPHVDDPILSGWIQRQELNNNSFDLSHKTEIQRAKWYANNGYWYDFIGQIKPLQINNLKPNQFQDSFWQEIIDKY